MDCGVYRIFCTVNGKSYIGSSVRVVRRLWDHRNKLRRKVHHNPYLQNAWNKHGESVFELKILEMCDEPILRQREKEIIDRVRPEFNCRGTDPLQGLTSQGPETRERIRTALLGRHLSPETVEKIRVARLGKPGAPCSPETREKMRIAHLGQYVSNETRAKMSEAHQGRPGRPHSQETLAKISAAGLGRHCSPETREKLRIAFLGRYVSDETRAKMSRSHSGGRKRLGAVI